MSFLCTYGMYKKRLKDFRRFWRLSYFTIEILHAIILHVTTMLLYVLLHSITLDLYYNVFFAITNPSSNRRMTHFFMFSYIASLPHFRSNKYKLNTFTVFFIILYLFTEMSSFKDVSHETAKKKVKLLIYFLYKKHTI